MIHIYFDFDVIFFPSFGACVHDVSGGVCWMTGGVGFFDVCVLSRSLYDFSLLDCNGVSAVCMCLFS